MELVATLGAHEERVWAVAWQPAGGLLASCGSDTAVKLWRGAADSWHCSATLQGPHRGTIRSVAWARDGQRLVTASFDGTACIWQRIDDDYECVATLEGHESEVKGCGFSPSGNYVATCSRDKSVWIWERYDSGDGGQDEYECSAILNEHSQDVKAVRWHLHQDMLASAGFDNSIVLYRHEVADQSWLACDKLVAHTSTVWCLDFNAAGDRLVSGSADKTLVVWQAFEPGNPEGITTASPQDAKWLPVCTITGYHERAIYGVSWCSQTGLIASACGDNTVRVFKETQPSAGPTGDGRRAARFELLASQRAHSQDVNGVAWQPHAPRPLLASCSDDGSVCLWTVKEG